MFSSEDQLFILSDIFIVLWDKTRLAILLTCVKERLSVGEIAQRLSISQSLVSHNLRLLKAHRLVRGSRVNKQIFYEAADAHVKDMINDMMTHVLEKK